MRFNPSKRLFLSCIYLGALFLVGGFLLYRLQYFEGALFLRKGSAERLVFRQAKDGIGIGLNQRAIPRELLAFDDPGAAHALRPAQHYDGVILPFFVRVDAVEELEERPPRYHLAVEGPEAAQQLAVEPGQMFTFNGSNLEFVGAAPWEGLVRVPAGKPMAAISLDDSGLLFLDQQQWYLARPDLAVQFLWSKDEAALRASTVNTLADVRFARWGVRDGKAIQWFDNFATGTGTRLRNGESVQLVEDRRKEGEIILRVMRDGEAREVTVAANAPDPASPFLFEMPAHTGRVIMVHAWREGQCVVRLLREGHPVEERTMSTGESWAIAPDGISLRVEQLLDAAVALPGEHLYAATVKRGEDTHTIREGVVETVGELRISFRREPTPPLARYTLSILDASGQPQQSLILSPGDQKRIGTWVLSLSDENPFAPAGIALSAVRRPGGLAQVLGALLLLGGSFGLVLVRFGVHWGNSGTMRD